MMPVTSAHAPDQANTPCGALPFPLDAVFTWVDGADPVWREAKRAMRERLSGGAAASAAVDDAARFRDNGELRYALRSVARYAPWIRRVHLVTAGHKPSWLNTDAVNLVSHREIFPEDVPLPVFSTRPIELCVHRIPGLAEHFIYANDDFMLGRPVAPGEFFRPDGTPLLWVVKCSMAHLERLRAKLNGADSHAAAVARSHALIFEKYGMVFPYLTRHYPRSMVRTSAASLWNAFPEAVRGTLHSPFRSLSDITVTALYPLYLLAEGAGEPRVINGLRGLMDVFAGRGPSYMGVSLGESRTAKKMASIRMLRPRTFCLNDAPRASEKQREALSAFLDAMFPEPCHYELPGA